MSGLFFENDKGQFVPADLLTPDELRAMDLTAELANAISRIVGNRETQMQDLTELLSGHIHPIQHAIMAQAAARAYPDRFRLLGGTVPS